MFILFYGISGCRGAASVATVVVIIYIMEAPFICFHQKIVTFVENHPTVVE